MQYERAHQMLMDLKALYDKLTWDEGLAVQDALKECATKTAKFYCEDRSCFCEEEGL